MGEGSGPSVAGEPAYCSSCGAPVVLYIDRSSGYRLVCGCPQTAVELDGLIDRSTLFTPISGKWSQLDDAPEWDWDEE